MLWSWAQTKKLLQEKLSFTPFQEPPSSPIHTLPSDSFIFKKMKIPPPPVDETAPSPYIGLLTLEKGGMRGLWCVSKPTVRKDNNSKIIPTKSTNWKGETSQNSEPLSQTVSNCCIIFLNLYCIILRLGGEIHMEIEPTWDSHGDWTFRFQILRY